MYLWALNKGSTQIKDWHNSTGAWTPNGSGYAIQEIFNAAGTYGLFLSATDRNEAWDFTWGDTGYPQMKNITIAEDATGPVITLLGANPQIIEAGAPYVEFGATAEDNRDGAIPFGNIVKDTSGVNTNAPGTYQVIYSVSDSLDNAAPPVTRTIRVADTTTPVITRTGSATVNVEKGTTYTDAGATVSDSFAGNLTANIVVTNPVNANAVGTYTVRYNVSDPSGNAATEVTRTVNVVDTTPPPAPVVNTATSPVNANSAIITGTAETGSIITITGGAGAATGVATGGSFSISVNLAQNATNNLSVTATDASGNISSATTKSIVEDSINPVITITGANPKTIEYGSVYADAGATASDNVSGNLTANITATSAVNTNILGSYSVTYGVSDAVGNTATAIRTVTVVDTTTPIITLIGANPQSIEGATPYVELGATATDAHDGSVAVSVGTSSINTNLVGSYVATYSAADSSGNTISTTRSVVVVDTTKPVITRNGSSSISVEYGSVYTDLGATASDTIDGNLTTSIGITNPVNTATLGAYIVRYNVSDSHGNAATEVTRSVNVVDTTLPVITLNGNSTVTQEAGVAYSDLGATASDNHDGNISGSITTTSTVNVNAIGNYIVRYNATDSSGNEASEVTRAVLVTDTIAPTIALIGASSVTIEVGSAYSDAGATASDSFTGSLTGNITTTSTVNNSVLGTYSVTYNVSDPSGNTATPVIRTINVVDTTKPIITLIGSSIVTVEYGSAYSDAGATATDNYNGNLTGSITTTSTVNTNALGSYSVTYGVSDSSGNSATSVTRIV
ncbi:MAG: DUF5011 domain-containing protein, partial [Parcubacteria group bacterium]|nr:DUF5011 domain-containing protein [Parcubacteria group bacterium]